MGEALENLEVHKGEDTIGSIKFLKCGQAGKTKETVKAAKMFNFVLISSTRDGNLYSAVRLKD